jgi:hypothetical protein
MMATQWTAQSLMDITRVYRNARLLLTGAELDLFTLLADQPLTAEQVCAELRCDQRAMTMVLDALAAIGVLVKRGEAYQTVPSARAFLVAHSPESIAYILRHQSRGWQQWSHLTKVVRHGGPANVPRDESYTEDFIRGMHNVARLHADRNVAALEPTRYRRLLDVGGGPGTYIMAFLRAAPDLRATLFDLPAVCEIARDNLRRAGLLDRVTISPGDFYADPLPGAHDLALVSAIIHQNSRQQNRDLFAKVFAVVESGGHVVVRDHVMDPLRTQPASGALFAVHMLLATEGGGTYTFDEIAADLRSAGFVDVELVQPDQQMDGLVRAKHP